MNKILIVEDDKILNRGVTFALKKEGYEVICAYSKEEGREVILNNKIDFLLLDINLPDGSGLDLWKEIRDKAILSKSIFKSLYSNILSSLCLFLSMALTLRFNTSMEKGFDI